MYALEQNWVLIVDESGDFSKKDETVCVAGLFAREPRSTTDDNQALLARIANATPTIAYPPHTKLLNIRSAHLVWYRRASEAQKSAHRDARLLRMAFGEIAFHANASPPPPIVTTLLSDSPGTIEPTYDQFLELDSWIYTHAVGAYAKLRTVRDNVRARLQSCLAIYAADVGSGGCFALAAADHGVLPKPGELVGDRYLRLLAVLFERIYALLRTLPQDRHTVTIQCLTRHVTVPGRRWGPLQKTDVQACISRAEQFPLYSSKMSALGQSGPANAGVRLIAEQPIEFNAVAPARAVLADYIANGMRHPLTHSSTWSDVTSLVQRHLSISVEAFALAAPCMGPMPAVAAAGQAHFAIREAFALPDATQLPQRKMQWLAGIEPGWNREQAARWLQLRAVL